MQCPSNLRAKSTSKRGKLQRASRPKTKRGCFTCKARRVKCDETHPSCQRCLSYSGHCMGYTHGLSVTRYNRAAILSTLNSCMPISCPQIREAATFRNHVEFEYFADFRDSLAPCIGGFGSSTWNCIMMQAAHHEQFVRDAIIAISALGMSLKEVCSGNASKSKHHKMALTYYDGAVREMRQVIFGGTKNLRKALLACLLVFCFESLQGSKIVAISHARCGYALLRSSMMDSEVELERSETPIETDIINSLESLTFQVHLDLGTNVVGAAIGDATKGGSLFIYMPERFSSIYEADQYWQSIMRQWSNFGYRATTAVNALKEAATGKLVTYNHIDMSINKGVANSFGMCDLKGEQKVYLKELVRWDRAFEPLRLSVNPETKSAYIFRRIRLLCIQVFVDSIFAMDEMSYDEYASHFCEIVTLCRIFINMECNRKYRFSLDLGIIPSLYYVTKACRHKTTRMEAINILRLHPRREIFWHSLLIAEVSEWLMTTEEEQRVGKFIPDYARLRVISTDVDMLKRTVTINWTRKTSRENDALIKYETVMMWNSGAYARPCLISSVQK